MRKILKIQPIISTGYRPIKDGSRYDKYFPKASVIDKMVVSDRTAEVDDVVELMQKVVWKYRKDTLLISEQLKAKELQKTITNIWDFLYHHIQYKLDTSGLEELRRPARLWHDKVGDCDDYAITASSILTNLNIPHAFRITKYDKEHFQHVYVVVPHAKGHYVIDPVLSQANYEKPFTEKKDFNMNLNGINVAVLSGFGNTESSTIEDMLLTDLNLEGLGSLSEQAADDRMYKYLVSTRAFSVNNKASIAHFDHPENFIKSLDYAIKYWHTPKRQEALAILAQNEEKENQFNTQKGLLSGWEDEEQDDGWDDLEGLSDDTIEQYLSQEQIEGLGKFWRSRKARKTRKTKRKVKRKQFWGKVKTGLKKAGKTLNRFNPGVAAIRGGILIALRVNMFGFKKRLKWAYASDTQLQKAGIKKSYAQKSKKVLARIEKIYEDMRGQKKNLQKAILKGKKGQLTGAEKDFYLQTDLEGLQGIEGLGAVSSAAMLTAATTVLALISKIFKKNKLGKEEKVGVSTPQNSSDVSRKVYSSSGAEEGQAPQSRKMYSSTVDDNEPANIDLDSETTRTTTKAEVVTPVKKENKILKLLKDNPVYTALGGISILGILGLSVWGVSSAIKSKKGKTKAPSQPIAGHSNSKDKKKPKSSPILKIEKLK